MEFQNCEIKYHWNLIPQTYLNKLGLSFNPFNTKHFPDNTKFTAEHISARCFSATKAVYRRRFLGQFDNLRKIVNHFQPPRMYIYILSLVYIFLLWWLTIQSHEFYLVTEMFLMFRNNKFTEFDTLTLYSNISETKMLTEIKPSRGASRRNYKIMDP